MIICSGVTARKLIIGGSPAGGRLALLSAPLGFASLCYEQGQPNPFANVLNCSIFGGNHCSNFGGRGHSCTSLMSYQDKGNLLYPLYSFADYVIMDEAGQILPEIGIVPFAFAKKAIIFGDEQQLTPITELTEIIDKGNLSESEIRWFKNMREKGILSSSGNMIKFAHSACKVGEDNQRGVGLKEHFRCRKEIIEYCNILSYNGRLTSQRNDSEIKNLPPFIFINTDSESKQVEGTRSRFNEKEAEEIVEWISKHKKAIIRKFASKETSQSIEDLIMIVTPFRAQEELLIQKLV